MTTTKTSNPFADYAEAAIQHNPADCPLDLQMMTFFGRSGTGKTSVAAAFPNHIYLDLEASATEQNVNLWPWGKTWARFSELIELTVKHKGGPLEGKTLVIDPASELWEMCFRHICAKQNPPVDPIAYKPSMDFGGVNREARAEFARVMQMLLKLRMEQRMGTILIAHEVVTEEVTPTDRIVKYEPKAGDKWVSAWIAEKAQMILRFSIEDRNPMTGQVWTGADGKPSPGPRWVIRTKPLNASDVVKDRTERLDPFVPARYEKLLDSYNNG